MLPNAVGAPLVVGIDPGLDACGVAVWDGHIMRSRTIRPKTNTLDKRVNEICDLLGSLRPRVVVIEKPQVYKGHLSKGDPNDLIDLAILVGALVHLFGPAKILLPKPVQWKGQVPKRIHHARIKQRVEIYGSTSKDALDAVGLCLWGIDHA